MRLATGMQVDSDPEACSGAVPTDMYRSRSVPAAWRTLVDSDRHGPAGARPRLRADVVRLVPEGLWLAPLDRRAKPPRSVRAEIQSPENSVSPSGRSTTRRHRFRSPGRRSKTRARVAIAF